MTTKKKAVQEAEIVPEKKPTEISLYEKQQNSVENMITSAIEKGLPVETMEKILAMRRELKAEWAKEQFDRAMAACQSEMPVIRKGKMARDEGKGKDLYAYAPLDAIIEVAAPIIARHGLSYSFKAENSPTIVKVRCIVKHVDGHSEESDMETALSTKTQIMSAPQQIAATVTFNKRYAFVNAFGITTGGEDNEDMIPKDDMITQEAEDAKSKLAMCITEDEFRKAWSGLSKEQKANKDVIIFGNQILSYIRDAKKNEAV